jgi:3-deoxy-D-manno-oct-2-ulosonic acid (Kdo) hydroxylase
MAGPAAVPSGPEGLISQLQGQDTNGTAATRSISGLSRLVPFPLGNSGVPSSDCAQLSRWCCEQLELGNILFFPAIPFDFPDESRAFLLQLRKSESRHHKNIAYRPAEDRLSGFSGESKETQARVHEILRSYSGRVVEYLSNLLLDYKPSWRLDYASFRPFEEQGRNLRTRARNDLLHTDAFPTRPTNGDRILRFFTNLNPEKPRVWLTGQTFQALAEQYAAQAGLPSSESRKPGALGSLVRLWNQFARVLHVPITRRSPYDEFMLRFHHYLKENSSFQNSCPKTRHEFPAGSCWMVFTDMVSHAVLSGQFALEQTFIVPRDAMLTPEKAPVRVLERLCGHSSAS